jgi:hypothetical protein
MESNNTKNLFGALSPFLAPLPSVTDFRAGHLPLPLANGNGSDQANTTTSQSHSQSAVGTNAPASTTPTTSAGVNAQQVTTHDAPKSHDLSTLLAAVLSSKAFWGFAFVVAVGVGTWWYVKNRSQGGTAPNAAKTTPASTSTGVTPARPGNTQQLPLLEPGIVRAGRTKKARRGAATDTEDDMYSTPVPNPNPSPDSDSGFDDDDDGIQIADSDGAFGTGPASSGSSVTQQLRDDLLRQQTAVQFLMAHLRKHEQRLQNAERLLQQQRQRAKGKQHDQHGADSKHAGAGYAHTSPRGSTSSNPNSSPHDTPVRQFAISSSSAAGTLRPLAWPYPQRRMSCADDEQNVQPLDP